VNSLLLHCVLLSFLLTLLTFWRFVFVVVFLLLRLDGLYI